MSAALIEQFDLLATSLGGVAKLRELILSLAVRGQLVPQDPNDEPASDLLKKIRTEKDRLIAEGKIKRDKPLAEIGEDEKPYELPEGWKWVRLGSLIDLISGQHLGPTEYFDTPLPGSIPYLTGPAEFGVNNPEPTRFTHERRSVAVAGDILVTVKGSGVGKTNVLGHAEMAISRQLMAIRPIASDRGYLELVMTTLANRFQAQSVGIAIPGISREDVLEAVLSLPPLAEQSRIVAKVEELMALCDRLEAEQGHATRVQGHWVEAALDQLAESADADELQRHWQHLAAHWDQLFTTPAAIDKLDATLLQLAVRGKLVPQDPADEPASELLKQIRAEKDRLIAEGKIKRDKPLPPITDEEKPYALPEGWEWVRLNTLLAKIGAGSTPLGGKDVYTTSGVKFLRSQNVWNEGLRLTDVAYISPEIHVRMSGTVVLPRDILFNITGASIGRCALVDDDFDEANVSQHVTIIRPALPDVRQFLHLVLISSHVQQTVMDVQVGVSREGLSIGKLGQFLIPIPPFAEQSRIVAQVEKLLALTATLRAHLTAAQAKQAHLAETLIAEVF